MRINITLGKQRWVIKTCEVCGKPLSNRRYKYCCNGCYEEAHNKRQRETHLHFSVLGVHINIYTGDFKEEARALVEKIKEKKYQDIIRNPRKYLR